MNRLKRTGIALLTGLALALPISLPVHAASFITLEFDSTEAAQGFANLTRTLESSGYELVGVDRTLLGRYRVLAENGFHRREIIISRTTGEIKHDAIVAVFRQSDGTPGKAGASGNGSTGSGGTSGGLTDDVANAASDAGNAVGDALGGAGSALGFGD